ncbi:MAG: long-chain-fatty-acid--CoA ligase [Acidiferrobacterales bacterium]
MEKIWLKHYQKGIPAEVDLAQFTSLKDIIEKSCRKYKNLPAYSNMGVTLTYAEVDEHSRRFSAYLQKVVGLEKGDRVAIMMPNVLQYPVALFGILRAGMTAVNVNPLYTPRELEHQMNDSGTQAIVILENFAHTLEQVISNTPIKTVFTTQIGDMFPFPKSALVNFVVKRIKKMVPPWNIRGTVRFMNALNAVNPKALEEVHLTHDDIAFLQYTGGTTGVAKGAMLTHGNMVANLQQASAWVGPSMDEGVEVVITALPLYHIFSLTVNCLVFLKIGAHNVLITNPRDFPAFVKELKKVKFSVITGVNTLFNALLHTPGFDEVDFSRLKLTLGGGMQVQRAVAEAWQAVTGVPLIEAYGLTETSPGVCVNPLDRKAYTGAIGIPIPSTEVSIQTDDGKQLALGEVGEICVRGPQVMRGYWNRPEETEKAISKDGWFRTGDMGRMEENGYVFIEDRKKDMVLVSGFNVYPNEIESVVVGHGGVLEAAAIGVPDAKSGEAVKLFVVRRDPELTAERIIEHCRKNLAGYKIPKHVEFRDELPKTNVGKILRRALRDKDTAAT